MTLVLQTDHHFLPLEKSQICFIIKQSGKSVASHCSILSGIIKNEFQNCLKAEDKNKITDGLNFCCGYQGLQNYVFRTKIYIFFCWITLPSFTLDTIKEENKQILRSVCCIVWCICGPWIIQYFFSSHLLIPAEEAIQSHYTLGFDHTHS